ncbi:E3 ubiquitin-protein ligase TRIM33-like isoform X2 [Littorina saxatilis]|uniref:E3 ubiquitin-protein ligase TRIM33-like isoform X2 n=1 Tax=Littorina saxatilis TaxID=31220 RepID=UPI0038B59B70
MATADTKPDEAVTMEASDLECPVCSEYFTDPKLLPCAHLVCRSCLTSLLQQKTGAACPLCRCVIAALQQPSKKNRRGHDQDSQEDVQTAVDQFPTDESMAALVEATLTLSEQHVCCACVDIAAASLCLQCGDMFCGPCTRLHQKQSLSKHHDVEDLDSLTAEKLAAKRRIICDTHSDKMCELFCPTHGRSICHLCAASKHRECSDVKDLEEKTEDARKVLADLVTSLTAGEQRVARAIREVEHDLKETDRCTQEAKREMEAAYDRLEKALKACRRRLNTQLLNASSDVTSDLTRKKSSLVNGRVKLTSHKNAAQRMHERPVQRIDMATVLKTRVDDLDCGDATPKVNVFRKMTLAIDEAVLSRLEKEIAELGRVDISEEETPKWRFNMNYSRCIELSNNQQTAENLPFVGSKIVMSQDPMKINILYEVEVDVATSRTKPSLHIGVVTQVPERCPLDAQQLSCAVVISPQQVVHNGWEVKTSVGAGLGRLKEGSRVGLWLDKRRGLHLCLDGKQQGQIVSDVDDPCYAMFELGGFLKKITALPVTRVDQNGKLLTS